MTRGEGPHTGGRNAVSELDYEGFIGRVAAVQRALGEDDREPRPWITDQLSLTQPALRKWKMEDRVPVYAVRCLERFERIAELEAEVEELRGQLEELRGGLPGSSAAELRRRLRQSVQDVLEVTDQVLADNLQLRA